MVNIVTIVCSHRDSFMDLKKLTVNLFYTSVSSNSNAIVGPWPLGEEEGIRSARCLRC